MKRTVILALGFVIALAALAGYVLSPVSEPIASAQGQPTATAVPTAAISGSRLGGLADLESAFAAIYAQANPSVVTIETTQVQSATLPVPTPGFPFGGPDDSPEEGLGSGFVWDNLGNIVTNNHVVAGANQIWVTFSDGTIVPGKVVGADPDSDLAVVKVDVPANQLRPAQIGDSNQVKVGQLAIAIGNPFGEQNTMTIGIISALGRSLPVRSRMFQGSTFTIPDIIQTDAPINPGNSGGVLLNIQGQVIGVTAAIASTIRASSGIGYAIPSAAVQKVIPTLIKDGRFQHPYLGISGTTLIPSLAQAMGLKGDQRGALVGTVTPGGPAEKAGLRSSTQPATVNGLPVRVGGDVIIAMNGQPVKSFDEIVAFLARSTQINQTITLTILRDGKQQDVQVTLVARPGSTAR